MLPCLNKSFIIIIIIIIWTKDILGSHLDSEGGAIWCLKLGKCFTGQQGTFVWSFKSLAPLVSEIWAK